MQGIARAEELVVVYSQQQLREVGHRVVVLGTGDDLEEQRRLPLKLLQRKGRIG